jgi:hypothetical protein
MDGYGIFFFHEICRAPPGPCRAACTSFSKVSLAGTMIKGNFSGFNSTPVSPKYRHFGNIVLPVDIPGGVGCVHRSKKRADQGAVSRIFRRREDEWEDVPGTGTPGRPALAEGLLPCDPVLTILIYK